MLRRLTDLIRLRSQWGTLLLLLPTLWALVLASKGEPSPGLVAIFIAGSFVMRSAGVIVNDFADRRIDREVARTRLRPLASGAVSPREALAALVLLLAAAAALLSLLPSPAVALSPGAIVLAAAYPYAKRVVDLPQAVLGMAFGWGVLMAWAAVQGGLSPEVGLLYAATVFWAIGYGTVYAMQDRQDDARLGVRSSALLFGDQAWLAVAGAYALTLGLIAVAAARQGAGTAGFVGLAGVAAIQAREVWRVRRDAAGTHAFAAFRRQAWVGVAVLAALWAGFRSP